MKMPTHKRAVNRLFSGLLISLLGLSGTAFAQVSEVEPNDDTGSANVLSIGSDGTATASGVVGTGSGMTTEFDFYMFDAAEGSAPEIRVVSNDACANLDPAVTLFDASGQSINMADNFGPFDPLPAGMNKCDALITPAELLVPGTYYVVVTPSRRLIGANFQPMGAPEGPSGGYTLSISGVVPAEVAQTDPGPAEDPGPGEYDTGEYDTGPTPIAMEILNWRGRDRDVSKRWKRYIKRMKKRKGIYPIPVVMFSSEYFNATEINPETLRFGVSGNEDSLFRCSRRGFDVNRDGMKDMVCFFDAFKTGFDVGDVKGVLNGECDGEEMGQMAFTSSASLKVFKLSKDNKRKKWRKRHNRRHDRNHSRWHRNHDRDDDHDDD